MNFLNRDVTVKGVEEPGLADFFSGEKPGSTVELGPYGWRLYAREL